MNQNKFITIAAVLFILLNTVLAYGQEKVLETSIALPNFVISGSYYSEQDSVLSLLSYNSEKMEFRLINPYTKKTEEFSTTTIELFRKNEPIAGLGLQESSKIFHWIYLIKGEIIAFTTNFQTRRIAFKALPIRFDKKIHNLIGLFNQDGIIKLIYSESSSKTITLVKIRPDLKIETLKYDFNDHPEFVEESKKRIWANQPDPQNPNHLLNTVWHGKIYPLHDKILLTLENKKSTILVTLNTQDNQFEYKAIPFDIPLDSKEKFLSTNSYVYENLIFQFLKDKSYFRLSVKDRNTLQVIKQYERDVLVSTEFIFSRPLNDSSQRVSEKSKSEKIKIEHRDSFFNMSMMGLVVNQGKNQLLDIRLGYLILNDNIDQFSSAYSSVAGVPQVFNNGAAGLVGGVIGGAIVGGIAQTQMLNKGAIMQLPFANGAQTSMFYSHGFYGFKIDVANSYNLNGKTDVTFYDRFITYQSNGADQRKKGIFTFTNGSDRFISYFTPKKDLYHIVRF
jgi:hypothetical protein